MLWHDLVYRLHALSSPMERLDGSHPIVIFEGYFDGVCLLTQHDLMTWMKWWPLEAHLSGVLKLMIHVLQLDFLYW